MNSAVMFSKASDEWSTPQETFDALNAEFEFDRDCAATAENTKCASWLGPSGLVEDALTCDWGGEASAVCWLNPPYSMCREFIAKAREEALKGCTVVCLVPSRTDTRWWHDHVWNRVTHSPYFNVEIRFIKGRLKFGGATAGAPFPSVIIIFRPL